jgi:dihydroorotate dehydrogenase
VSIELAPLNKRGLTLTSPLIAGSGAAGFGAEWPPGVSPDMFGAVVTAPLSLHARRGSPQPRLVELPGGFLLATGDHNPGYRRVIREHAPLWRSLAGRPASRSGTGEGERVPVIVALASSAQEDWTRLAALLETQMGVEGLELCLPHEVGRAAAAAWIGAVRRATELPLLVKLPVVHSPSLAEAVASAGADTLVVGTAPLGAYPATGGGWVEAPMAGPVAFPFTLQALRSIVKKGCSVPLVAAGGIHHIEDAQRCFDEGASAVQVRSLLWIDPAAAAQLAAAMRGPDAAQASRPQAAL